MGRFPPVSEFLFGIGLTGPRLTRKLPFILRRVSQPGVVANGELWPIALYSLDISFNSLDSNISFLSSGAAELQTKNNRIKCSESNCSARDQNARLMAFDHGYRWIGRIGFLLKRRKTLCIPGGAGTEISSLIPSSLIRCKPFFRSVEGFSEAYVKWHVTVGNNTPG